jgi:hypothetical protein
MFIDIYEATGAKSELSPLFLAIRSGSDRSVNAVIDAGVNLKQAVYSKRIKAWLTPLEYAIRIKKIEPVGSLLQQGAILPPISQWPTYRSIYNKLRDAKKKRDGVLAPKYTHFQAMNDQERAAL